MSALTIDSPYLVGDEWCRALESYIYYGQPSTTGAAPCEAIEPQERLERLMKQISALQQRVERLEGPEGQAVVRVKAHLAEANVLTSRFVWAPEDYYQRSLEERAVVLNAAVPHLCKTMLVENMAHDPSVEPLAEGDRSYERFYLVVLQYGASLQANKLLSQLRDLRGPEGAATRLGRKKYDLVMAPEANMEAMTGFEHGAVTPFGSLEEIPIILSEAITQVSPAYIWMGGGHPRVKLGCSLNDFVRALNPLILDVSSPR